MALVDFIEDVRVFNSGYSGGVLKFLYSHGIRVVFLFRLSQFFYKYRLKPVSYFITNVNDLLHGVWIGPKVVAGGGLSLAHSRGLVVNPGVVIGRYCTLLNGVTIGEHAVIGAGAVVVKSVPLWVVVGGIPAKILKKKDFQRWFRTRPYLKEVWGKVDENTICQ